MSTTTIYARVSAECYGYVKQESERSGVPLAQVVDALLTEAARRGWTLGDKRVQIVDPADPVYGISHGPLWRPE